MIDAERLRERIEAACGRALGDWRTRPVAGGCINQAFVLDTGGERFFVKSNTLGLGRHFEAEAAGLRALRASGTSLRVPEVVALADDDATAGSFLVLEYVEPGRPGPDFDERLGVGLAELHGASDARGFGFEIDGYCGASPQPNGFLPRWVEFYAQRRLDPQIGFARARGMAEADLERLRALRDRLGEWLREDEPPALIHGDLWSGNVFADTEGRPVLVDPAAYYADREAELGMMALFGGFSPRVWESYAAARPPRKGWRSRLGLYTLYHLLNHFALFGGAYGRQALECARQYGV